MTHDLISCHSNGHLVSVASCPVQAWILHNKSHCIRVVNGVSLLQRKEPTFTNRATAQGAEHRVS